MKIHLLVAVLLSALLSACGGDSKKGTSPASSSPVGIQKSSALVQTSSTQTASSQATAPTPVVGVLVDAFVAGIGYRTATQSGVTNAQGEFNYLPGETVTFFIGALEFPPVPAKAIVTPLDMARSLNPSSPVVLNIARLLQSLDTDGNPANGISISPAAALVATQVDFNLGLSQFAASPAVSNLIANSGSSTTTIVPVEQALAHLRDTLQLAGVPVDEGSSSSQSSELQVPASSAAQSSAAASVPVVPSPSSAAGSSAAPASSLAASAAASSDAQSSETSSAAPASSAVSSALVSSSALSSSIVQSSSALSSRAASSSLATSVVSSSVASIGTSASASSLVISSAPSSASASSHSSSSLATAAPDFNTVYGYASVNGGTTGGAGANAVEVAVCNGADLTAALTNPAYADKPLTIYVDGVITWHNSGNKDIKLNRPNVSIIGRGNDAEFWGTGIHITASNVIVRNLKMYHVPQTRGQGDIITIDGRNGPVRNVWIDHNELYNDLDVAVPEAITDPVAQAEYKKDYYDELVSGRSDVADITISYNYLHDSWKTSLWGSSDEDNFDRRITWHHNYWHHVNSRLPLFRFGKGHIYNNYYHNVDTSAINSRMGAIIRVERNVFENTKNPVMSQDSSAIGYWELIENQLRDGIIWSDKEDTATTVNIIADELLADNTSTGTLTLPQDYLYAPSLIPVEDVPAHVQQYAGVGKITTAPAELACTRPEWDIEPPPPPTNEPVTADPASVSWNLFNGNASPFDANAITLADGVNNAPFVIQGSASDFTPTGAGAVLFDSTSLGTKNNRARISNVGRNDGVYPKYFTLIAGVKGFNPPANARVLELETTFGGTADTAASRLKVVLRADGASNYGVQFEGAPAPNTAYGLAMDEYRVYHFTVALSSPTTGWARAYLNGSDTPVLNQEEVQFATTTATNNYLQIGDGGSNSYKALVDWMVWTDAGAYTPAQLSGLLPANIGCVKGYGPSENLLDCDFSAVGVSSSAASSSAASTTSAAGSSADASSVGVVVGSSTSAAASSAAATSSSTASAATVFACANEAGLYFCDDFASGAGNWDLLPAGTTANGVFDVLNDAGNNNVLRYTAASSGALGGLVALIKPEQLAAVTSADYYVEARIRPRLNSSGTAQRSIYVMARYLDVNNWYGMGMIAHETNQPRVEIVERSGTGNPASTGTMRYNTAISLGTAGATNGEWYKLRLELIGTEMKLYLNDLQVASFSDVSLTERGSIGIFTSNRSFEIDDIKVGNANDKPPVPSQLTISPTASYSAEVGDAARVITVTAKNPQNTDDTFTVESSNPAVVAVSTNGYQVSLNPVGEGTATITFTSGSDASLTRTLTATIAPQFVMPTASYNLTGLVSPAANEANVYADTSLSLTFDSPPTLGTVGAIRIFKSSDDSVVDTIKLVDHKDTIGYGTYRTLNTRPISISGNTATIALQSKKLEYNTSYYVAVSASAFTGATLATLPFEGIGKNAGWTFTTKPAPAAGLTSLTVDDTGNTADFRTLQGALNYVMQNLAKTDAATITVNKGTYPELLYLRNKDNLTITGESRDGVLIQYQNSEGLNPGSAGRPVFLVELADMLTMENLTLKNTTIKTGSGGQAETIYFNSTGRLVAKNANFISEQDTLQLKGYSWFYRTLVAGNVDFIWGNNNVSLFEESEIRSLGDSSNANNGGYVVQARTLTAADKGFVFLNSNLTQGPGPVGHTIPAGATYLARSPGGTTTWDNVVFINSRMDTHINAAGWAGAGVNGQPAPNPVTPTATTGWREFATMNANGDSISLASRVGGYELTLGEVMNDYCNRAQIFAAYNSSAGWNPLPGDTTDCANFGQASSSSSSAASVASESSSSVSSASSTASSDVSSSASSESSSSVGASSEASSSVSSAYVPNTEIWTPTFAALQSAVAAAPAANANANFNVTATPITIDGITFYSATAGSLRLHLNSAGTEYAINYNGTSVKDDTAGTPVTFVEGGNQVNPTALNIGGGVTRFISVPFTPSALPITLTVTYSNGSATAPGACQNGQVAIVDQNGKTWKVGSSCSNPNKTTLTATITDPTVSELFILMSRNGDGGGGIRIWQVEVTQ
ncbi:pectinesterase family protein [Cellvibrio fibrivorans]|uniref:Pectate lyase n=1 Tax=Cellvibrio fibrivorans TaxID=126350 RepID=A0ABU1UUR6_9GAMM|nr:pectinesterase family protein [Cellvibrio fibrivorans]MDR7088867.1 pectate lyase [Cellvibrio fibrivorans]